MRNRNPPRAIFAANDLMAIGALDAIKDLSLRIPEQVAIVGFDNIKMSALVDPKLTTVSYPAYRMGALAARLLFDTIDSKNIDGKPREIHLQVELKIRKSCGHTGRVQEIFS
jgi:DNA-binding LacI/PurR family transcriptional regulator